MRVATLAAGVAVSMAVLGAGSGAALRAASEIGGDLPARSVVTARRFGWISLRGGDRRWILVETKRPGMVRLEVGMPRGVYRAGFDGTTAWQTLPGSVSGGRTLLPEALARRIADLADPDGPARRWRAEGYEVRSSRIGPGGAVVRIDAASPSGSPGVLLADAKTGNVVEWDGSLGDGARARRVEARFDAYVEVGGIDLPSCISVGAPGEAPSIVIEFFRFEIDPEIDDRWFAPPPVP